MESSFWLMASSFVLTVVAVKLLQPVALWLQLVDNPGGRKQHQGSIPLIGGWAVFMAVFTSVYMMVDQELFIRFFMIGCGLMLFLGGLDDRYQLSPNSRLVGQIGIALIFVYGLDIKLSYFGHLFGNFPLDVGWLGGPLAVLSIVGVINAFNMLDGMDGLIGSVGIITFGTLSVMFNKAGAGDLMLICSSFVGALCAFLVFNLCGKCTGSRKVPKIFMGDSGSMLMGLATGVLLIHGAQGSESAFEPITALWFVLLPMTDMFTLMYRRLKRGKSPFMADRTHIHHILLRAGYSRGQALVLIALVQAALVGLGVFLETAEAGESLSFLLAVGFVGFYQFCMQNCWRLLRWKKRAARLSVVSPAG